MKTALITGVNGQDGSYLAEHLLSLNYRVVGTVRKRDCDLSRIEHLEKSLHVLVSELDSASEVERVLTEVKPEEFYNLAARASASELWADPVAMGEVNGLKVVRILQAILKVNPDIRFCQASSSEIFGNAAESPQSESTPLSPRNPYGCAKAYAQWMIRDFRETCGLFACSAILFNHESPRRRLEFVTRKITHTVAKIRTGLADELRLGNLDAQRDWGFAGDYVRAMHLMLCHSTADDYVIATGKHHSVREFCELAFSYAGLNHEQYVKTDPANFRHEGKVPLVGNAGKARQVLGWQPTVPFRGLVRMMVDADLKTAHTLANE